MGARVCVCLRVCLVSFLAFVCVFVHFVHSVFRSGCCSLSVVYIVCLILFMCLFVFVFLIVFGVRAFMRACVLVWCFRVCVCDVRFRPIVQFMFNGVCYCLVLS